MQEDCKVALRRRGICVLIPTFNNAGTIVDVVSRARKFCSDVFVVDDGCTDDTLQRLEALEDPVTVISLGRNTGKGNALRAGFRTALAAGFSYAITLDGDSQHFPEDIPLFLEANRRCPDALIVGRRMGLKQAQRSRGSKFANSFSNFWFFVQTLVPLDDTQTGYRLYPLKRLHGLGLLTSRYEAELELLVFAAWAGVRIKSQDVRVYYPPREERVSHFRPARDFSRISLLNTVLCLLALVYGLPRTLLRWGRMGLRSAAGWLLYVLSALFVIQPKIFFTLKCGRGTPEQRRQRLHEYICRSSRKATRIYGFFGCRFSLVGNTREPFSRPAVIVCNHQSLLDLFPMMSLTPRLVILTADWVWENPITGPIVREADFLPSSRGMEAIEGRLGELVLKGYSIAIYPEGTRSPDGKLGRFHQGAFYLAEKFGVDVLPLTIYGTGNALPKHSLLLRSSEIRLKIGQRISPAQMTSLGGSLRERASEMRKRYARAYSALADSVVSGKEEENVDDFS